MYPGMPGKWIINETLLNQHWMFFRGVLVIYLVQEPSNPRPVEWVKNSDIESSESLETSLRRNLICKSTMAC